MNELNLYIVEREVDRADYYNDQNEEGSFFSRDIFFPAATESDVVRCEKALKCQLPKSYRNFLLIHNGAVLHTLEPKDTKIHGEVSLGDWIYASAGLVLMDTKYLIEFTNQEKEGYYSFYEESWEEYDKRWSNLIAFCNLRDEGDGSFLAFDPTQADADEYPILYCLSTENIEGWRSEIYYPSFKDFFLDIVRSTEILEDYNFLDKYLKSLDEST